MFVLALRAAGLSDTLKTGGPYTIFAPTDDAFGKLPRGMVGALLEDIPRLKKILLYHMVQGQVLMAELAAIDSVQTITLKTALGEPVTIAVGNGKVTALNGALFVDTDIKATNGVIHLIDALLMPSEEKAMEQPGLPQRTPTIELTATPARTLTVTPKITPTLAPIR